MIKPYSSKTKSRRKKYEKELFSLFDELSTQHNIDEIIKENAKNILKRIKEERLFVGSYSQKLKHLNIESNKIGKYIIIVTSIFIASRCEQPISFYEAGLMIPDEYRRDIIKPTHRELAIRNYYKRISKHFNLPSKIDEFKLFKKYETQFDNAIIKRTKKILKECKKKGILSGCNPLGSLASAIYIAAWIEKNPLTQLELSQIFNVSELTIRHTYQKIATGLEIDFDLIYLKSKLKEEQIDKDKIKLLKKYTPIIDIKDMPGFNPEVQNGISSVSEGKVYWDPMQKAMCKTHGAMLCVSENRRIWRCPACNVGCYRVDMEEPNVND